MLTKLQNKLYHTLRWSEKYTKTDMIYLTRGGFWITISQTIVSISSLLLAIAFANFVSKEFYGEYKYIISLAGILGTLTLSGLGTSITRSIAKGNEGTLNYAFWVNIKWSFLFFSTALGIAIYYFTNDNPTIGLAMLIVGSFSPIILSSNFYNSFLIAKKDIKRSVIYFEVIGNLFPAFCLFLTMLFFKTSISLVLAYFISNLLIGLIFYIKILKIYNPNKKIDSEAINYGKHLSLMNILTGLANNIDQIILFHFLGATQLAVYNFAIAIPNQIKGPLKGLDNLIFAKFTERSEKEIRQRMNTKIFYLFILLASIVIVYIFLAPFIFKFLFPKYLDAIKYSQIFALSIMGLSFWPTSTYLTSHKKISEQYIANLSLSLTQIILVFLGMIYGGLLGVIIARIITRMIWGVLNYIMYVVSLNPTE